MIVAVYGQRWKLCHLLLKWFPGICSSADHANHIDFCWNCTFRAVNMSYVYLTRNLNALLAMQLILIPCFLYLQHKYPPQRHIYATHLCIYRYLDLCLHKIDRSLKKQGINKKNFKEYDEGRVFTTRIWHKDKIEKDCTRIKIAKYRREIEKYFLFNLWLTTSHWNTNIYSTVKTVTQTESLN